MSQHKPISAILHRRQPWVGDEQVYVCTALGVLNGGSLSKQQGSENRKALYLRAKFNGDHGAAALVVKACLNDRVIDRIIDDVTPYMQRRVPVVCVVPHPPFDDIAGIGADLVGKP